MNINHFCPVISIMLLLMFAGFVLADNSTNPSSIVFTAPAMVISSPPECHDYVLEKVTLDKDFAYTRAGRSLTPRIIVRNQGGDDISPGDVLVEAWLGETQLIPVTDTFPPLKGKTSAMFHLRFMIPHDIPKLPCHLTIKIDPWNTRNECGDGINEFTTLSLVVIEDKVKRWDDL